METQNLTIRKTTKNDIRLIYDFINGLALYEKRPEDMTGSEEMLEFMLFEKKIATAIIAEVDGNPVGYALYYPVFGSFAANDKAPECRKGRDLEDLFIKPEFRRKGLGKEFFFKLLKMLKAEGYSKIEWSCLDWNTPSIEFYKKIGAQQETGRVYFEY